MAWSLCLNPVTRTQSLATSNGKLCHSHTSPHCSHRGLGLPVKDGVKHEVLKNYLYPFRSSFLQRSQLISHNCKHVCNFSITELTIPCCCRFFQIVRCWEEHLETSLSSLLSKLCHGNRSACLNIRVRWQGKDFMLYNLGNFSIARRIKSKSWTWFFRVFYLFIFFLPLLSSELQIFYVFAPWFSNITFLFIFITFLFILSLVVFTFTIAILPRIVSGFP